jgi:serine/threonine protein kinase
LSNFVRYKLVRVIATGGMAMVLEGIALGASGFSRRVAIKRIRPELAKNPAFQRAFLDEAKIASHLHHANIVQVLDYGVVDGTEFIVLEYVEGTDAAKAARSGVALEAPMPVGVAFHIIGEIAHALDYAHQCSDASGRSLGIIHRDISPQNILLSWTGDVKLSDFGIAFAEMREEETRTGQVKGKWRYMSPEQIEGRRLSPASDVFGLGATLHMLLAPHPEAAPPPELSRIFSSWWAESPSDRPSAREVAEEAGHLAARHLEGSPRGALREWLELLRTPTDAPSAFDNLAGMCLVRAGESGVEFTAERGLPTDPHEPTVREGPEPRTIAPPAPPPPDEVEGAPAPSRHRGLVIAGIVAVTLGGATAIGELASRSRDPASAPLPAAVPTAPPPTALASSSASVSLARSRVPSAATVAEDHEASVEKAQPERDKPEKRTRRARPPRTVSAERRRPSKTIEEKPAQAMDSGWIRVGGPELARALVEVDGRTVGHAPLEKSIEIGGHRIVVKDPETGAVILDENVTLRSEHRRAAPLIIVR